MTFQEAQLRLLAHVRERIHNGELTERRFARLLGISQPHVHNVLKGARTLSPDIFDSILRYFHLSLLDLARLEELEANLKKRRYPEQRPDVHFLASPIGPGMPWPVGVNWRASWPLPFPARIVPASLFMADLIADPSMAATHGQSDLALLDTSEGERGITSPEGVYVVLYRDEALLRYVRPGSRGYYLVSDDSLDQPAQWNHVTIPSGDLLGLVKARVRWLGKRQDQRGRFLHEPISS